MRERLPEVIAWLGRLEIKLMDEKQLGEIVARVVEGRSDQDRI